MDKYVWKTSSRSGNDGQCVEVMDGEVIVRVRDSKDQAGPELGFAHDAWSRFIETVKR